MRSPRSLRTRLTLLVVSIAAIVIAVLTAGFNIVLRESLQNDADQVARERAESALETVAVKPSGQIKLIEAPPAQDAGGGVWVYESNGKALERPPAAPEVQAIADSLAGQDGTFRESAAADVRLYARGIKDAGDRQVGTVIAALSLEPYESTVNRALLASLAFAALMLAAIALATRFLLGRALDPVSEMTRSATEWSEHDLDHRFAAGEPYDEITELAAAFDSMLDKLSASLRHEQRLTAEISHELRTPLAAIITETELALNRARDPDADTRALEHVAERSGTLKEILESLLAAARAELADSVPSTRLQDGLTSAVTEARQSAPAGVRVGLRGQPELAVDVEAALLERMLGPILDNAIAYASAEVVVSADFDDLRVVIEIADDGPGVSEVDADQIFEPGYRGSQDRRRAEPGTGLGLALSRRLAKAAGGDVTLRSSPGGGALFVVRLPGRRLPNGVAAQPPP